MVVKQCTEKEGQPQNIAKCLTTAPQDRLQSHFLNKFTGIPFFKLSCFRVGGGEFSRSIGLCTFPCLNAGECVCNATCIRVFI